MNDICPDPESSTLGLHSLEDYAPLIGTQAVERILNKAQRLRAARIGHVSSTLYGGGVGRDLDAADPADELDGHRNWLACDTGNSRIFRLHQEDPQRVARRASRIVRR
jgi:hypothetical protein